MIRCGSQILAAGAVHQDGIRPPKQNPLMYLVCFSLSLCRPGCGTKEWRGPMGTTKAAGGPPPPGETSIAPLPSPLVVSHFPFIEQYSALALGSCLSTGLPSTFSLLWTTAPPGGCRLTAGGWWLFGPPPLPAPDPDSSRPWSSAGTPPSPASSWWLVAGGCFGSLPAPDPDSSRPRAVLELLHLQLAAGGWWLVAGGFPFQPLILNLEQWDPLSPAIPQLYLLLLLLIIIPVLFLLLIVSVGCEPLTSPIFTRPSPAPPVPL